MLSVIPFCSQEGKVNSSCANEIARIRALLRLTFFPECPYRPAWSFYQYWKPHCNSICTWVISFVERIMRLSVEKCPIFFMEKDCTFRNNFSRRVPPNVAAIFAVQTAVTTDVPRNREGESEPKLIPKYHRDISGIEEKVLSLYARDMSTRDIHDQIQDLYGMELSAEMASKIADRILPEIKEWQSRPLNPVYPYVFMDCIHYKGRKSWNVALSLRSSHPYSIGISSIGYHHQADQDIDNVCKHTHKLPFRQAPCNDHFCTHP